MKDTYTIKGVEVFSELYATYYTWRQITPSINLVTTINDIILYYKTSTVRTHTWHVDYANTTHCHVSLIALAGDRPMQNYPFTTFSGYKKQTKKKQKHFSTCKNICATYWKL
jgi:hypothetical protein